jgi:hypothetical protein
VVVLASHASGVNAVSRRLAAIIALGLTSIPCAVCAQQLVTPEGPLPARQKPVDRMPHFTAYSVRGAAPRGPVDGMGLYATTKGTAVDLTSPDHMLEGPSGSLFNQAAGFGWRNHNVSAMVGYMKPSSIKSATEFSNDYIPQFKSSARFGVGWAMHF